MNIIDVVVILIILAAAIVGFKRGFFKELVMTIGFLLVFIISFYLKNPIAEWLSLNLPFFNFAGPFKGITILNVILYQLIAFIIVFSILMLAFRLILTLTGILEKILKYTIILGIPSKILGFLVGLIEGYIIAFMFVFVFTQPMFDIGIMNDSKFKDKMLSSTPILTNVVSNMYDTVVDVYELIDVREGKKSPEEYNKETTEILLKHKLVNREYIAKLTSSGKLKINNINEILEKY